MTVTSFTSFILIESTSVKTVTSVFFLQLSFSPQINQPYKYFKRYYSGFKTYRNLNNLEKT